MLVIYNNAVYVRRSGFAALSNTAGTGTHAQSAACTPKSISIVGNCRAGHVLLCTRCSDCHCLTEKEKLVKVKTLPTNK